MIKKKNIDISKITWIHRGGKASNFYEPENMVEFIDIIKDLNKSKKPYVVIGHTSNLYFKQSFDIDTIVSTRRLCSWNLKGDYVECECGVSISKLSRMMVEEGVMGFEGLVDLPGTIGGALYGNAGCYDCSVSELLYSADVLAEDGSIKSYSKDDFNFTFRNSALKSKDKKVYVLKVRLKHKKGDKDKIKKIARDNSLKRKLLSPPSSECELRYNLLLFREKNNDRIYNR